MALTIDEAVGTPYADLKTAMLANPNVLANNRGYAVDAPALTHATITFSGTYTGTPTTIYARVIRSHDSAVIKDWTALTSATISGGTWVGTLNSVPRGDSVAAYALSGNTKGSAYKLQVSEAADGSGAVTSTNEFRVGLALWMWGQSNAQYTLFGSSETPNADCWMCNSAVGIGGIEGWGKLNGSASALLNYVNNRLGCPVFIGCWFRGATSSFAFLPGGGWDNAFTSPAQDSGQDTFTVYGRKVNRFLANHFENDSGGPYTFRHSGQATGVTDPQPVFYEDRIDELHGLFADYCGTTRADAPWIQAMPGPGRFTSIGATYGEGPVHGQGITYREIIDRMILANKKYPHIRFAVSASALQIGDTIHYTAASGLDICKRYGHAVTTSLGLTTGYDPEVVSAAVVNATTTRVTIAHGKGTDLIGKTASTDFTGFEVYDGATWHVATANRASATTLDLVTVASLPDTTARRVRYAVGYGAAGGNGVVDNSDIAGQLRPTLVQGIACTASYRTLHPRLVDVLSRDDEAGYVVGTGHTTYPWTWPKYWIGDQQAGNRVVWVITTVDGVNESVANSLLTVSLECRDWALTQLSTVSMTRIDAQNWVSIHRAVVPGWVQTVKPTLSRAVTTSGCPGFSMWVCDEADLASLTPSINYKLTTAQTSDTLSLPTVPVHAAIIGHVANIGTGINWPIAEWTDLLSASTRHPFVAGYSQALSYIVPFTTEDNPAGAQSIVVNNTDDSGNPRSGSWASVALVLEGVYEEVETPPPATITALRDHTGRVLVDHLGRAIRL